MNLIPKIAEMLGVEIWERFEITSVVHEEGKYYYFSETELLEHVEGRTPDYAQYRVLADLIYGDKKIIKLPFEPKDGEKYWFIGLYDEIPTVMYTTQHDAEMEHYERKYCGNKFRSRKEAYDKRFEIYEKLTGKKWEGELESDTE